MVGIWSAEKARTYGSPELVNLAQDDEEAIHQMQCADHEQDEYNAALEQYEEDNNDFCDFNGNDIPAVNITPNITVMVFNIIYIYVTHCYQPTFRGACIQHTIS